MEIKTYKNSIQAQENLFLRSIVSPSRYIMRQVLFDEINHTKETDVMKKIASSTFVKRIAMMHMTTAAKQVRNSDPRNTNEFQ